MSRKFLHFVLLAALVAVSSLALAAEPPALVGRIAAAEGRVTVQTADGDETGSLLNWPVKGGDRLVTARGARTEFRVGPVAVRLDGDSELDIEALDDDVMRLRLEHGTASVRVRDAQALSGFELALPQGRVLLAEPGTVRVDTGREPGTTTVSVLMGIARLEAAGTVLTLRTGKRAEIRGDDVRTGQALQDGFDAWAFARDRRDDAAIATRYIPNDVTGYEELDQYGSWTVDDDYGPLWAPRAVPPGWAPYSDGRWAWVAPWGWTWVDNAPWGYAPSHYGRWVLIGQRWCWAPGRIAGRPAWAPALVGWVGGAGWSVAFDDRRQRPGLGWYPLTPRDRYVPHYPVSPEHERRLDWQYRGGNERWRSVQVRREGVTIVPRDRFEGRRSVRVNELPRASVAAVPGGLPSAAPVVPVVPGIARPPGRQRDGIADRDHDGVADRPQRNPLQVQRLQTGRDHDGVPDGVPGRVQVERPRDGVPGRFQDDRQIDSAAERMQRERNEAPLRGSGVTVTERPRVERPPVVERLRVERPQGERPQVERSQVERPQIERLQVERPAGVPVSNAPAPVVAAPLPRPAPLPQPAPLAAPQPQVQPQPQPQVQAQPQVQPRAFGGGERMERQRERMQERAEARQEMESRRQAAAAQQRMSVQPPAAVPAPPPPRPEPPAQPRPAPVAQPAPAGPPPGAQPAVQPRGGRPERQDRDGGR